MVIEKTFLTFETFLEIFCKMTFIILHSYDKRIGLLPVFAFDFHPWKNFPHVIPTLKPLLEEQKVSLYMKHRNFLIF